MSFAIETEGLIKIFRNRWSGKEVRAVDGISLGVEQGSTFGLLGPNGAGKTTFVNAALAVVVLGRLTLSVCQALS